MRAHASYLVSRASNGPVSRETEHKQPRMARDVALSRRLNSLSVESVFAPLVWYATNPLSLPKDQRGPAPHRDQHQTVNHRRVRSTIRSVTSSVRRSGDANAWTLAIKSSIVAPFAVDNWLNRSTPDSSPYEVGCFNDSVRI
jgi:hypothetical protein